MTTYRAPVNDVLFTLNHICDLSALSSYDGMEAADPEVIAAAVEEAGKLANEILAPINRIGDQVGASLENGVVTTPPGFKEAYGAYRDGGWNSVPFDPDFGGMGLPMLMGSVCNEFWNGSNMGFSLCPLLTIGAVEAIYTHGTEEQKSLYLEKLVSGEWTGTMNLTEPHAGSDVGALRSKAEPVADGSWRITGQKIFITYGDHDFSDNIIHLVLARTPGSPEGTKGISLFIVPKFLVNPDGSLGTRNDLRPVSLEEKCGVHASPTAVMSYGDNEGAIGYLLGEENQGMRCMFTMMNNARLNVGLQGVAVAEAAYQQAANFSLERRQGRSFVADGPGSSPIVEHADVRRMLMTMKALTEASRALCYSTAEAIDLSRHHPDSEMREWFGLVEGLLTPMAKSWSTDIGCEVASMGMQVHGGMGFIEETGAAQYYRDVRITPIYEGTNGIQAMDLMFRKLPVMGGEMALRFIDGLRPMLSELKETDALKQTGENLEKAIHQLEETTKWVLDRMAGDRNDAAAGCSPYLKMFALTLGGYYLAKGALAARKLAEKEGADTGFLNAKITTARYFGEQLLPQAVSLAPAVSAGAADLYAISEDQLIA